MGIACLRSGHGITYTFWQKMGGMDDGLLAWLQNYHLLLSLSV
jgi:hypothetical protein